MTQSSPSAPLLPPHGDSQWEGAQPKLSAQWRLKTACEQGDGKLLAQALAGGADIESVVVVSSKATALMLSAGLGHAECVQMLIDAGANIDAVNHRGATAALLAAQHGKDRCLTLLLAAGANSQAIDREGDTCAIRAARGGHHGCIRALIQAGANVARPNRTRHPRVTPASAAVSADHPICLAELISAGVDLDAPLGFGYTLAMVAAQDSEACVRLLIDAGVDLKHTNDDGNTASMVARLHGRDEIARLIEATILARSERTQLEGSTAIKQPQPSQRLRM